MSRAIAILRAGQTRNGDVIDTLLLDYEQRRAPAGTLAGLKGTPVEIALPNARLATDDCLILEDGTLVEVVARPEPLIEARARECCRHGAARLASRRPAYPGRIARAAGAGPARPGG